MSTRIPSAVILGLIVIGVIAQRCLHGSGDRSSRSRPTKIEVFSSNRSLTFFRSFNNVLHILVLVITGFLESQVQPEQAFVTMLGVGFLASLQSRTSWTITVVISVKSQISLSDADQELGSPFPLFVLNVNKGTVASISINMRILVFFNVSTVSICSPHGRVISWRP